MPWCDACSRFFTPNALRPDGTCPVCGRGVAEQPQRRTGEVPGRVPEVGDDEPEDRVRVPWHFWVLLLAAGIYLGWRAVQGVGWLVDRL